MSIFDLTQRKIQLEEKEQATYDPTFWDHPDEAETVMKEINSLKRWIQMYEKVEESVEELEVLFEFFEEGEVSEEEIESQYVKTVRVIEDVEIGRASCRERV